ncbi:MAG: pyrimidine/purine nucleoside phosphorylase [Verrucomicrobia bacterium]|nr:pyrimidine/purine nucleoside phosphorylase [Verrucomicrobiota bacterium]
MPVATEFSGVTVVTKANVYFEGRVVSHTVRFPDGSRKTLGLIFPGNFYFGTEAAERMEIVSGTCRVKLKGSAEEIEVVAGGAFEVPAKSGFDVSVASGQCEYICSFLP